MLSAREAMQQAIERAQVGDIKGGMLWLGIARELRQGTVQQSTYEGEPVFGIPDEESVDPHKYRASGHGERAHLCWCGRGELAPVHHEPNYGATMDGQPAYQPGGVIVVPAQEPAYRRAETEVLERIPQEPTPAYEAAGNSLETTRAIPYRVAHPEADEQGPDMRCLSCLLPIVFINGRGWSHDVEGHPASCDNAAAIINGGPYEREARE
jgi:hypothetical protein